MFFVITYEDGTRKHLEAGRYADAVEFAEAFKTDSMGSYTVEEYASKEDWENSLQEVQQWQSKSTTQRMKSYQC